jgi:hypothetical protein
MMISLMRAMDIKMMLIGGMYVFYYHDMKIGIVCRLHNQLMVF